MFKKIISLVLVVTILFTFNGAFYAQAAQVETYATVEEAVGDLIAYAITLDNTINELEDDLGITIPFRPKDFAELNFTPSAAWIAEAEQFLEDYVSENQPQAAMASSPTNTGASTVSTLQPDADAVAKSSAIMFSIDAAKISKQRTPSIDLEKEIQYMFLAAYVDRPDYYWANGNIAKLTDGYSRVNSAYLYWLTPHDRLVYESYINTDYAIDGLESIGKIGVSLAGLSGQIDNIISSINIAKLCNESLNKVGATLILETIRPYAQNYATLVSSSSNIILDGAERGDSVYTTYNNFMVPHNIYGADQFLKEAAEAAFVTYLAFVLSGPAVISSAAIGFLVQTTLTITLEAFVSYFNYVAWLAVRQSYNMRNTARWYYKVTGNIM